MNRLLFLACVSAATVSLIITPSVAQQKIARKTGTEPVIPAVCPLPGGGTLVTLLTALGPLELALDTRRAPLTAGNFLKYVDQKRMDGATFYRVMKTGDLGKGEGVVQGGQRLPGKALPPIAHEPTTVTGLSNVAGALSMARGAPGTATSDFFIMMNDIKAFDANPAQPGDNLGYAVFGRVTQGMDLVRRIYQAPIDAAKGPMPGQMIADPIRITAARRTPLRAPGHPDCTAGQPVMPPIVPVTH